MAFTPKDWKDYPDTTTPITAAALEDMETRLSAYVDAKPGGVFSNVTDYGAKADGTTDDTAAIQAAIDALPISGGTVFFPGESRITATLKLRGKRSVTFLGLGGLSSGAGTRSRIIVDGPLSQSCTIDTSTDLITATAHGLSANDKVTFTTSGTLPTINTAVGWSSAQPNALIVHHTYFVSATSLTSNAFKVSYTPGGTPLDLTGTAGTGHKISHPAIDARDAPGFCLRDLQVIVIHAGFTGHVIDMSGPLASTGHCHITRAGVGGNATGANAISCVYLDNNYSSIFDAVFFGGAQRHIYGMVPKGDTQSNAHNITGCYFVSHSLASICNPREAWAVTGCTFQPGAGGKLAYLDYLGTGNTTGYATSKGLAFTGCYAEGTLSQPYAFRFSGFALAINGCFLGGGNHTIELGVADGASNAMNIATGVSITGSFLNGAYGGKAEAAVYANTTTPQWGNTWIIQGNAAYTTAYTNMIAYASAYSPANTTVQPLTYGF